MSSVADLLIRSCIKSVRWEDEYDVELLCDLTLLLMAEGGGRSEETRETAATIRERLESKHGLREAIRIIKRHCARLDKHRHDLGDLVTPEIFVITTLVNWLRDTDGGKTPTAARVGVLIDSLKAYAPFFKDTPDDERRRLGKSEALRPMLNIALWLAQRDPAKGEKHYVEQLERIARLIFDRGLFFGKSARVDKWINQIPLRLAPGTDKSRSLFGVVKAKTTPRHTSDG